MTITRETACQNRLLQRLSVDDLDALLPHLRPIDLPVPKSLVEPGEVMDSVTFPLAGLISLVSIMRDGSIIEIGTVGIDGGVGLSVLLGRKTLPYRYFSQISGHGLRMGAENLLQLASERPSLERVLLQSQSSLMVQVMQSTACNGLHQVEQRCCKWLLIAQDRVNQDRLALTHEFIGQMLGVRRASVSEVLKPLRDDGLLTYTRGEVTILNRAGLEERACECYRIVTDEYRWLDG